MDKGVIQELKQAVISYDEEAAAKAAKKALEAKIDPNQAITEGLTPALREMGERFEKGEAFLPELIMAADAMTAAVKILEKEMSKEALEGPRRARSFLEP